jgi:NADP-dependent 3-hydroxy acid dehydrogenase YdfG
MALGAPPVHSGGVEQEAEDMGIPEGAVAIVTGASSGIGAATAAALAKAGARVVLAARRKDRLESLAGQIGADKCLVLQADVSTEAETGRIATQTMEKWGRIDILVNNAGVMMLGPVAEAATADWRKMFDLNVLGLMYMTHAVLPTMKTQKRGHIINISSVSGRVVSARSAVYSATKFAVGAFSEGLRQELIKEGVRITAIEPGAVATELADHITDAAVQSSVRQWVASLTPLAAEDIAAAVLYAASQPPHVGVNEILLRPAEQLV